MDVQKRLIVLSSSHNPWYNLALEEYLLNQIGRGEVILYLWQNQNTVVIGRNQNAWKECRCQQLEADGGKLARRLSGGGAVYHDLGNLNFTFILDRELYDLEKQLEVILQAVRSHGIDANFSGRNDLVVGDKKFSGNAFYFTSKSAYHHGTILIDTDFSQLVTYLQVSADKIKSKGIDSVRSRVVNLLELNPELTIKDMQQALRGSFAEIYGGVSGYEEIDPSQHPSLKELHHKYSSWDWLYGQTPDFDITFDKRFSWGGVELGLEFKKGLIDRAVIYSDAMDGELIQLVSRQLEGVTFKLEDILLALEELKDREIIDSKREAEINDLQQWLGEKSI